MNQLLNLSGKVAVVTGAAGGIGASIVTLLEEHGATTIATDVVTPAVRPKNFFTLDVRDTQAIKELAAKVNEKYGAIDIWINNAGYLERTTVFDITPEQYQKTLDINLRSTIFGSQAAATIMRDNQGGSIVNISSYAGLKARPNCIDYASSKAGVSHATKSLALELGEHNIRVNCIAPGYIDTVMSSWMHKDAKLRDEYLNKIPLKRLGNPEEIAQGVLYLVSPLSSYVTGHTLIIDGGITYA